MATLNQIRGMLLEEAVLFLLRRSGYKTVERAISDPDTLREGRSGLEIKGRGGYHQIDAIADYVIATPFTHAQRLLLEAKFYTNSTAGLDIVRNAVGVLRDASEFWETRRRLPPKARYHYQYAIFSASGYSGPAQRYAYAQDVYLIPLSNSRFVKPILDAIRALSPKDFGAIEENRISVNMKELRIKIRKVLRGNDFGYIDEGLRSLRDSFSTFSVFIDATQSLSHSYLTMLARRFPVFLAPANPDVINSLFDNVEVRIFYDEGGWYIEDTFRNRLFSFDLPDEIIADFIEDGQLNALNLKEQVFNSIQLFHVSETRYRFINLRLDQEWINQVRRRRNHTL